MKVFLMASIFSILLCLAVPATGLAEKFESPEHGFSINPPEGWSKQPSAYEGVVVTYWKEGGLATFHVIERNLEGAKTVSELKWEDLFSPKFEEITIRQEAETMIGGEKARYCIYKIKPGAFKQQMEGKADFKYMNYILVKGGRLYSITFKDLEDAFSIHYVQFLDAIRSIRFVEPIAEPEKAGIPEEEKKQS